MKPKTLYVLLVLLSCHTSNKDPYVYTWHTLEVTATAYNSISNQTDGDPYITAFGDSLKSSVKSIAVSRDLLRMGLTYGTQVKIEGLNGIYIVNDKMHHRWRNKIDIYMNNDIKAAKQWGRRKVKIQYLQKVLRDSVK